MGKMAVACGNSAVGDLGMSHSSPPTSLMLGLPLSMYGEGGRDEVFLTQKQ